MKSTTSPMVWLQESQELLSYVKSMAKDSWLDRVSFTQAHKTGW
jgi:hypothetical protein